MVNSDGVRRCRVCGEKLEDPSSTAPLCFGCRQDRRVPGWFPDAENYVRCEVRGIRRATCRPRTGLAILDTGAPPRLCDVAPAAAVAVLEHMQRVEQQQGLEMDRTDFSEDFCN